MPLYLVRWPSLTATLIRAGSEAELMDIIDEVGTPGGCTWSVYRGPLMIDFKVPIEYEVTEHIAGLMRSEDVKVREPDNDEREFLDVAEPDSCDTAFEMKEAMLRQAFPLLANVIYEDDYEAPGRLARIAAAVADDIARQSEELQTVGVTFGDDTELLRTRRFAFMRQAPGVFIQLPVRTVTAFCCGNEALPSKEGVVCIAHVDVAYRNKRPVSARLGVPLRLRTDDRGHIIVPHRADAFADPKDPTQSQAPMHKRRNETVAWDISRSDLVDLSRALESLIGDLLAIERRDE